MAKPPQTVREIIIKIIEKGMCFSNPKLRGLIIVGLDRMADEIISDLYKLLTEHPERPKDMEQLSVPSLHDYDDGIIEGYNQRGKDEKDFLKKVLIEKEAGK
jgi:hypothetical protein